jgi:hypothetical protein
MSLPSLFRLIWIPISSGTFSSKSVLTFSSKSILTYMNSDLKQDFLFQVYFDLSVSRSQVGSMRYLSVPVFKSKQSTLPIASRIHLCPKYLFQYWYQVESHCLHIQVDPSASGISSYYSASNIKLVDHPTIYTVKFWTRPFVFLFLVLHPPVPSSKHQHSVCGFPISVNPFSTFYDRTFNITISYQAASTNVCELYRSLRTMKRVCGP